MELGDEHLEEQVPGYGEESEHWTDVGTAAEFNIEDRSTPLYEEYMEYASMEASTTDIGVRENGINPGLFGSHEIQLFEPSNMQATVTGSPEELIAFAMRLMEVVRDTWPLTTQIAIRDRVVWNASVGKDKG